MNQRLGRTQIIGQVIFYAIIMAVLGYFSSSPEITLQNNNDTSLKLIIRHSGRIEGKCEPLSKLEQDKLPTNMQRLVNCPRQKSPLKVIISVDDEMIYNATIKPSGIHDDGVLADYSVFTLKAGTRHIVASAITNTHEGEFVDRYNAKIDVNPNHIVVLQLDDNGFNLNGNNE